MPKRPRFAVVAAAMGAGAALAAGCSSSRIAVDYQILVDRGNEHHHVKETEVFRSGEEFRLRITTHEDCCGYVLNRGTSGQYHVLFPHPRIHDGSSFIDGWEHVYIPPVIPGRPRGAFRFDERAGVETLIMVVSDRPIPALETIARDILDGRPQEPEQIEQLLHQLEADSKHDGEFQKEHHRGHTQVVLESPNPEAVLVNVIRLEHAPGQ